MQKTVVKYEKNIKKGKCNSLACQQQADRHDYQAGNTAMNNELTTEKAELSETGEMLVRLEDILLRLLDLVFNFVFTVTK